MRLSTDQLSALTEPTIDPRELKQILTDGSSIYRDEQSISTIEKAIQKAHTNANDSLKH